MNDEKVTLPPIGSEWYEDDPRIYPTKITVLEHLDGGRVVIGRGLHNQQRTKASAKRFGKRGGYKAWLLRAQHKVRM